MPMNGVITRETLSVVVDYTRPLNFCRSTHKIAQDKNEYFHRLLRCSQCSWWVFGRVHFHCRHSPLLSSGFFFRAQKSGRICLIEKHKLHSTRKLKWNSHAVDLGRGETKKKIPISIGNLRFLPGHDNDYAWKCADWQRSSFFHSHNSRFPVA